MTYNSTNSNPSHGISGSLDPSTHVHHFWARVYYHDTDTQQILHHAHYFIFAERARTEFLRLLYTTYDLSFAQLPAFVVTKTRGDYKRPVELDHLIQIDTLVTHIGGSYLDLSQVFWHNASEIFQLHLRLVCTNTKSHSVEKLPSALVKALETFSGRSQQIGRPPTNP